MCTEKTMSKDCGTRTLLLVLLIWITNLCYCLFIVDFDSFTGILFVYVLGQIAVWNTSHFTMLFFKIVFPFHVPSSRKLKFIYITFVIVGIVIPLFPILVSMADFAINLQGHSENSTSNQSFYSEGFGFIQARFPPLLCFGANENAVFYTLVIPLYIIIGLGCTMYLIMIWRIHKLNKIKKTQVSLLKHCSTFDI